jgi:hypothetical protein
MTAARRLAAILAVDVVTPDGRGRRGRRTSIANAARPITFNANNCFAATPTSTPAVPQRPVNVDSSRLECARGSRSLTACRRGHVRPFATVLAPSRTEALHNSGC